MINYKFYYFGPHLFHTKLSPLFCNELLKRGSNELVNCSENLAGHFNTEYYLRMMISIFLKIVFL